MESLGVVPLNVIEVGAGETHDLGNILVPAPATLEVDWRWPGEDAQYSYALEQVVAIRGWPVPMMYPVRKGQGRFSGARQILPGRFAWSVSKHGNEIDRQQVDVQPSSIVRVSTGTGTEER